MTSRRARLSALILAGLGLAAGTHAAKADDSVFVGRWHWNAALSHLPPGEPVPADMITDIARADTAHVRWSVTVTNAQGRPAMRAFDIPANGEFYPISGDTTASIRLGDGVLDATFKGADDETDHLTCRLSMQNKRMTCSGQISSAGHQSDSYVDVYDRS